MKAIMILLLIVGSSFALIDVHFGDIECDNLVADSGFTFSGDSLNVALGIKFGTEIFFWDIDGDRVLQADSSGLVAVINDLNVGAALTTATLNFADATAVAGSKNAITLDFTPDLTVVTGTVIYYVSEFLNDAATTIDVDGAGAVNIYDSADVGACSGGEIVDNMVVHLMWDGTQYQLLNTAL